MLGVYLTAAELTKQGFTVAITSRNAIGVDLFVTDATCQEHGRYKLKPTLQGGISGTLERTPLISSQTHTFTCCYGCMAMIPPITT
jgi:hypothetical protein